MPCAQTYKGKEILMADLNILSAQKRAGLGKGANRRLRAEEVIPGVFYSTTGENIPVQVSARAFVKIFSKVGRTTVFNLEIEADGKKDAYPVLVWDTQRHPVKNVFTHVDFYGVDLDKPVKVTVPLEFVGVARGTKVGGKLETYRERVQLMAKPLDMPAKVTVDISGMDVGSSLQIAGLQLPEGVKAAYDTNYAIVSVLMPGSGDSSEGAAE